MFVDAIHHSKQQHSRQHKNNTFKSVVGFVIAFRTYLVVLISYDLCILPRLFIYLSTIDCR